MLFPVAFSTTPPLPSTLFWFHPFLTYTLTLPTTLAPSLWVPWLHLLFQHHFPHFTLLCLSSLFLQHTTSITPTCLQYSLKIITSLPSFLICPNFPFLQFTPTPRHPYLKLSLPFPLLSSNVSSAFILSLHLSLSCSHLSCFWPYTSYKTTRDEKANQT